MEKKEEIEKKVLNLEKKALAELREKGQLFGRELN